MEQATYAIVGYRQATDACSSRSVQARNNEKPH